MYLHMIVSFIYIIKYFIHTRLVGLPQSNHIHGWLEEVVHHMALVEGKYILDEILDHPMKIIIQI